MEASKAYSNMRHWILKDYRKATIYKIFVTLLLILQSICVFSQNQSTITITSSATIVPDGGSVILKADSPTSYTYAWYFGGIKVGIGASYTALKPGTYEVIGTDAVSNTSSTSITLAACTPPKVVASIDVGGVPCSCTTGLNDVSLIVQLTEGSLPWSFTYTDGVSSSTITNITDNTYNVRLGFIAPPKTYTIIEVVDGNGCKNANPAQSASIYVDNTPPIISGTLKEIIIDGCGKEDLPTAAATIEDLKKLGLEISDNCTPNDQIKVSHKDYIDIKACPLVVLRTYTVSDVCGNYSTASHWVIVQDITPPVFTSCPSDMVVQAGKGEEWVSVSWDYPTATDNCSNFVAIVSNSFESGDLFRAGEAYKIVYTATEIGGCGNKSTCEFTITVLKYETPPEPPKDELDMPTGFSPNGDGINDFFVVKNISSYPNNRLTVYNRWGGIVYNRRNYANEWNGTNQSGMPLPEGTYFIQFSAPDQTIEYKGYVHIKR